jgi:hypothetical protein
MTKLYSMTKEKIKNKLFLNSAENASGGAECTRFVVHSLCAILSSCDQFARYLT